MMGTRIALCTAALGFLALVLPAAAGPRKGGGSAGCDAACKHRKECGVPGAEDAAGCLASCKSITPLFGPTDLSDYVKADCPRAQTMEAGFQTAARIARACAHHGQCMPGADDKTCLATNMAVAQSLPPEALEKAVTEYLGWSCEQVKADEPSYQGAQSCVRACLRAVACTRRGDVGGCTLQCVAGLQQKKLKPTEVAAFERADCATIAKALPPPPPPRPVDNSRSGNGCRTHGKMDCPAFTVCCSLKKGAMVDPGDPGTCISPPVCFMKD